MGVFGLLFLARYSSVNQIQVKLSVGIYHQNEFMYRGVNYYFSNIAKEFFKKINAKNIIFFNDFNRRIYSMFFANDYSKSTIVPIGIVKSSDAERVGNNFLTKKIVSIGNLNEFKTYNRHVISLMPELVKLDDSFRYVIYGSGSSEKTLKRQVQELGVEDYVLFKGSIPYTELKNVLSDTFLFVGSGTAIIEASSIGVPSVIGIESLNTADTYGFFYETIGYSYNEIDVGREVTSYMQIINRLNSNQDFWDQVSNACLEKALEFSIEVTYEGINGLSSKNQVIQPMFFERYSNFLIFISLAWCSFKHKVLKQKGFALRRNQGTLN